ncbi:hypothetical protein [Paenibacillus foliorum]|uniref:hypothetical protein n=1 Tax=Paenibacillus foliorum TaxID=2654974 RepID=UPI001C0FA67E|nr:hypothetical protein [Paenibacillus foliorum]
MCMDDCSFSGIDSTTSQILLPIITCQMDNPETMEVVLRNQDKFKPKSRHSMTAFWFAK